MDSPWIMVWCIIGMSMVLLHGVHSAPIKIDFDLCQTASYPTLPEPNSPVSTDQCCPIKPTKPIIDGAPPPSTKYLRVRQASQCTDADYAAKIDKAYALMRALPDDDPRSFTQQWFLHCSYCGGAFITVANSTETPMGVDIHFSWLFFPWHRFYLFFHERILQSLLGDPTFSLNYWNWDNPYSVGDGLSMDGSCMIPGHQFPAVYSDSSSATYDGNRSENAKGYGRLPFPDLTFSPAQPAVKQNLYNASGDEVIESNLNVVNHALVEGGTTTEAFMGRPYRAGDLRGTATTGGGAGSLESSAHAGAHFWTGRDPPNNTDDMGALANSARDPVFFAHHSNIDRLWQVWKDIGPSLGQNREYYSDPDFLNTEFLFYDENKDLRRVKISEALETENLGYVYQQANDLAWINFNQTRCSNLEYQELITEAESLSAPLHSDGFYYLQAGTPFVIVVDQPENREGADVFLTITGIKLDRTMNAGFDVFLDFPNPSDCKVSTTCAEYNGRFMNMAQSRHAIEGNQQFIWKESISSTLVNIQAPEYPARLVVTLVPLSKHGDSETISFTDIIIST